MSRQQNRFDAVKVSSACSSSWDAMSGTSEKKFCSECNKHVYDFSQLSRREADAIMEASRGNLCARITRTEDGRILSKDPIPVLPVKIQSRRTSHAANLLMSAVLGITPMIMVAPAVHATAYLHNSPHQNPDKTGGVASISGVVTDAMDAVLPNATISLFQNSEEMLTAKSNDEGVYSFQNLKPGNYSLKVRSFGYQTVVSSEIQISEGQSFTLDVKFEAAAKFEALSGVVAMPTKTLRVRYLESPLIVDATVGKSTIAEVDKHSKLIKTELHINSFLKGFQAKTKIDYYHNSYEGEESEFKEGDVVLAFLESRETGQEGFQSSHYQKGLQVLTATEMKTYASRISELRDLTYQRKPTPEEISEWLVRCIQEPVTRWEGVQELDSGFRNLKDRLDEIEQCKKEGKPIPESNANTRLQSTLQLEEKPDREPDPDGKFAEALSVTQKNQLAEILFSTQNFSQDELSLLQLVMNWEKERSIPFVIHQLKQKWSEEFDPTSNLIDILENYFEDDEDFDELISDFEDIEIFEASELTKDDLSPTEKTERQRTNVQALAEQKIALQKIIDAAEMKLRKSTQ